MAFENCNCKNDFDKIFAETDKMRTNKHYESVTDESNNNNYEIPKSRTDILMEKYGTHVGFALFCITLLASYYLNKRMIIKAILKANSIIKGC